jgi:outer membrane immunogenic protein
MENTISSVIFMIYGIQVGSDERDIAMRAVTRTAAKTAFFVGALVSGMGLAAAADLPVKARPVAHYDWTGFYVGGNVGYGWSRQTAQNGELFVGAPFPLEAGFPDTFSGTASGFIGGGQAGYNFQIGRVVLGLEADLDYSGIKGGPTFTGVLNLGGPPFPVNTTVDLQQKLDWLATVRGRLGYTPSDAWLLYLTGGLAAGKIENPMQIIFAGPGGATYTGSSTSTRTGWTFGGGAEYGIGRNWTAKAEYLYIDLGRTSVTGTSVPPQPTQLTADFKNHYHIVRIGLNYLFN